MHRASCNTYYLSVCLDARLNEQDHPLWLSELLKATCSRASVRMKLLACVCKLVHFHRYGAVSRGKGNDHRKL